MAMQSRRACTLPLPKPVQHSVLASMLAGMLSSFYLFSHLPQHGHKVLQRLHLSRCLGVLDLPCHNCAGKHLPASTRTYKHSELCELRLQHCRGFHALCELFTAHSSHRTAAALCPCWPATAVPAGLPQAEPKPSSKPTGETMPKPHSRSLDGVLVGR